MHLEEAFEGLSAGFRLFLLKTVGYMQGLTLDSPGQPLPSIQNHPFFLCRSGKFPTLSSVESHPWGHRQV